ncbi:MAG: hypothetical protein QOG77_1265, partial [Solirubrobacteraceae bacterium]|nr:hypothetical protein [Solirubrobacteraceae bacterium]
VAAGFALLALLPIGLLALRRPEP